MEKENRIITKNGITIHSYKNPGINSFYISLFVRCGSMYEEQGENGITHFLEHSLIRNVNRIMNGDLYRVLDKYGIEFNASTYSEMVQLYVAGAKANFKVGAEIISKALLPLELSGDDIKAERDRIKAEIRESDDRTSLASFASGIIHEGTSLARPILGTLGGISGIGKSKLEAYRKRVFTSENIFFYVTGNISDADLSLLGSLLESVRVFSGEKHLNLAPVPRKFGNRDPKVYIKNADFTMVRFNFDMDMTKLSFAATDLLYDILLSGYNSDFFIEMSEKRGLFYDLTGAVERYKNIGVFSFSYELKGDNLYNAIEMTLSILKSMTEVLVDESELMKAGYVDNAYMLYDDPRELNFTFAYDNHFMNNSYASLDERAQRYGSVTSEDIRNTAKAIFKRENLTLTIKGNKKKIDSERIESLILNF